MDANTFASSVGQWAEDRNLVDGSSPEAQFTKLMEESIELYQGIRLRNLVEIKDGIGDCEVVLRVIECQLDLAFTDGDLHPSTHGDWYSIYLSSISRLIGRIRSHASRKSIQDAIVNARSVLFRLAEDAELTISECRAHAWNDIKDRKGRMVDGVFVKEPSLSVIPYNPPCCNLGGCDRR